MTLLNAPEHNAISLFTLFILFIIRAYILGFGSEERENDHDHHNISAWVNGAYSFDLHVCVVIQTHVCIPNHIKWHAINSAVTRYMK